MSLRVGLGLSLLLLFLWAIRALDQHQHQSAMPAHPDAVVNAASDSEEADGSEGVVVDDSWLGKTGLSLAAEQQLIRFIHMKLGEQDDDPSALQPEEMVYLGAFEQDEGLVRYWLLPQRGYGEQYATVTGDGSADVNYGIASSPPESMQSDDNGGEPMEPDSDLEEESSLIP